jgi:hypothetical protein
VRSSVFDVIALDSVAGLRSSTGGADDPGTNAMLGRLMSEGLETD